MRGRFIVGIFYTIGWCCHVQLFHDYSVSYVLIQILQRTAMTALLYLIQDENPGAGMYTYSDSFLSSFPR